MPLVRIIKDWQTPDLFRQTPGGKGVWEGLSFTMDESAPCDYAIILNRVPVETRVTCPPENIWLVAQEPPVALYRWQRKGFAQPARVYTPDTALRRAKYIHSHGTLPWHVNKTYDELKAQGPVDKPRKLSWITSNTGFLPGHQRRMRFLEQLRKDVEFDLWGRGFTPIADKWDGLAPYRYSLAIENHCGEHYWTEKLADCFLSRTLPIYHGAANIERYFPEESFVRIDINDKSAPRQIKKVIESDLWLKRRDAIEHARNLVLDKHQFFPFIADQIRELEKSRAVPARPCETVLAEVPNLCDYYRNTSAPRRAFNSLMRSLKG